MYGHVYEYLLGMAENYAQKRMHGTSILKGPSSKIIYKIAFVWLDNGETILNLAGPNWKI
jgi:hypothetical protein